MDFNSLRDVSNIKALFLEIWKSLCGEVSKLEKFNKDSFVTAFNKYFWTYLQDEYKKVLQLNLDYFKFEGRASRKQYWMFMLFYFLFVFLIELLIILVSFKAFFAFILLIFGLITFIPIMSLTIRRLHDVNLSGWFVIILLIPYIFVLLLIPLAVKGDTKANKYGAVVK